MSGITPIAVPKWGIEMQEGTFVAWRVDLGMAVSQGQEIADVETEKIVNALEAPADGILRRCLAADGDTLPVGSLLGVLAEEGVSDAAIDAFIAEFKSGASVATEVSAAPEIAAGPEARAGRIRASAGAKRLAEQLGIDLATVQGSGRNGRISREDVEQVAQSAAAGGAVQSPAAADYTPEPMSGTRKTIARRLVQSKQEIPHYYLTADLQLDALLKRREALTAQDIEASLNDLIVHAAALALMDVPEVNANLVGDEIRRFAHADVAVAVATDDGLVTPVLRAAETLSIQELSGTLRQLTEKARAGQLERADIEGGSFTVSNLGMFDIRQFTAIINPPQVAILAVGAARPRITLDDAQPVTVTEMTVTLSCDHRVVDGAVGARFLQALRERIEAPPEV
jgi:pyruvate dehydrogenase E2 component (dihydrolipoamide acetyltransferase)